jgi:hypothetical protein
MFLRTGAMNVVTANYRRKKGETKMPTFTLDPDNNITALAGLSAGADPSQSFSNAKELARLTAQWPGSCLVDTWNSFAGVAPFDDLKPVKKFTSRKAAVMRIWDAVQRLVPDGAPQAQRVAPERPPSKKAAVKAKRRETARKDATKSRINKKSEVIFLMRRAKGATLAEITEQTGWQKHTVRGFVSLLGSKGGLRIESSKNSAGERSYRIVR